MIEQLERSEWEEKSVDRSSETSRCKRRKGINQVPWELDSEYSNLFRVLAEGEVSWTEPEPSTLEQMDEYEDTKLNLEEAAGLGDEFAFVDALDKVNWRNHTVSDFIHRIQQALRAGAYLAAREISDRGLKEYPNHPRIREYSRVLAPATFMPKDTVSRGMQRRNNREWLRVNGAEYRGQWIAIRNGELLGVSESLDVLAEQLDSKEDVLLTTP